MNRYDILKLQASGKIRGHNLGRIESHPEKRVKLPAMPVRSKAKEFIELNLQYWCNEHAVSLSREHKFDAIRKWRFDYCIEAFKIAIEFEGMSVGVSGHTNFKGFTSNVEKYNAATSAGWKVLRFTFKNYKTLITELNKCI